MKRIATGLVMAVLILASEAAYAAVDYTWDGDTDQYWNTAGNWVERGYPGKNQAGDTATIDSDTANDTVVVSTNITNSVAWVLVDANTAGVSLMLQITSAGTLDVNGEVELTASSSANAEAELEVSSGATFQPDSLDVNGGNSSSRRAILDFDESVTVQTSTGTSVNGVVDIEIAANKTFDAKAFTMESSADLKVTGATGAKFRVDSFTNSSNRPVEFVGPLEAECY